MKINFGTSLWIWEKFKIKIPQPACEFGTISFVNFKKEKSKQTTSPVNEQCFLPRSSISPTRPNRIALESSPTRWPDRTSLFGSLALLSLTACHPRARWRRLRRAAAAARTRARRRSGPASGWRPSPPSSASTARSSRPTSSTSSRSSFPPVNSSEACRPIGGFVCWEFVSCLVRLAQDRLWELVDAEWMGCLRQEPVESLLKLPSGCVQVVQVHRC